MKPNIEVCVEELVLRGFALSDRHRIDEAVERELARLFTEQGAPPSLARSANLARLDGRAFEFGPSSKAETIGAQVEQAVFGGLAK